LVKDKILWIEARKPFQILEQVLTCPRLAEERFEPEKFLIKEGERRGIVPLHPLGRSKSEDVRTYKDKKVLGGQIVAQEILLHMLSCEEECSQLDKVLDKLFGIFSDYQKRAA